jgi:hypothetical protein
MYLTPRPCFFKKSLSSANASANANEPISSEPCDDPCHRTEESKHGVRARDSSFWFAIINVVCQTPSAHAVV